MTADGRSSIPGSRAPAYRRARPRGTERLSAERAEDAGEGCRRRGARTAAAVSRSSPSARLSPRLTTRRWTRMTSISVCNCSRTGWCSRTGELDGIFGLLTNVVWTPRPSRGGRNRGGALRARRRGSVTSTIDKFPRMMDYVGPGAYGSLTRTGCGSGRNSRTARRSCTRGSSTSTQERSDLDGRGPDLRGRRGRRRLRRRRRRVDHGHVLRRRQAGHPHRRALPDRRQGGVGISLGDDCVVEAGLYVTAGTG